jgi:hypothetical protein
MSAYSRISTLAPSVARFAMATVPSAIAAIHVTFALPVGGRGAGEPLAARPSSACL